MSLIAKDCNHFLGTESKDYSKVDIDKFIKLILEDIPDFREELAKALEKSKKILSNELQTWGNNIRVYDSIVGSNQDNQSEHAPSCLARKINQFIKLIRDHNKRDGNPTLVLTVIYY